MKELIVKIHRWFGLVMCVFFVTWFLSGFVMLYVDFPGFSRHNRLLKNSALALGDFKPAGLTRLLSADTAWRSIRIAMLLNRPVFRLESTSGELFAFYADNGGPMGSLSGINAEAVAIQYMGHHYQPAKTEKISELDQWIPRSFYLVHMPVYRITMNDPSETMIYVSSKSGEIIQVHTRYERILAWCGPIIHWIYPKELIIRRPLWQAVVISLSSLGIIGSLSGIIIGFIRMRRKTYSSPYKKKWFRWHHYTGFVFGLFTFTWVFSGLLTMSPFGWSPELSLNERDNQELQGGNLEIKSFTQPVSLVFSKLEPGFLPVEIEFKRFQGENYYIAYDANGKTRIAVANTENGLLKDAFPLKMMISAINGLSVDSSSGLGSAPSDQRLIYQEDNYYYSKHNDNKLPVLRIQYHDAEQTWYYADPSTGTVLLKNDRSARVNRWLYHGLHSLDFFKFQHNRPLWDILIIFLLTGGTAVSLTGIMLAVKWIIR